MKSPGEQVISKQACRDGSIVSLFFSYLTIYRSLLLRIEYCTTEKSKNRLSLCIYIYMYISEKSIYKYIYIYIGERIKEDASILYDSEFRA